MRNFFILMALFLSVILCYAQTNQNIPKEVYRLSMKSYYELYGKTPESVQLIKIFDKKRKTAMIINTVGSALCTPYLMMPNVNNRELGLFTISALALSIPTFGVGIGLNSTYSRKKLYRYLTAQTPIPKNLTNKL